MEYAMKAVVMNGVGDATQLEYVDHAEPDIGVTDVLVEISFAGVNFMDIGVRLGMAWTQTPNPKILGVEGAGRIVEIGAHVKGFAPGDRVAWVYAPSSYAERLAVPAEALVQVTGIIDDRPGA